MGVDQSWHLYNQEETTWRQPHLLLLIQQANKVWSCHFGGGPALFSCFQASHALEQCDYEFKEPDISHAYLFFSLSYHAPTWSLLQKDKLGSFLQTSSSWLESLTCLEDKLPSGHFSSSGCLLISFVGVSSYLDDRLGRSRLLLLLECRQHNCSANMRVTLTCWLVQKTKSGRDNILVMLALTFRTLSLAFTFYLNFVMSVYSPRPSQQFCTLHCLKVKRFDHPHLCVLFSFFRLFLYWNYVTQHFFSSVDWYMLTFEPTKLWPVSLKHKQRASAFPRRPGWPSLLFLFLCFFF